MTNKERPRCRPVVLLWQLFW